VVIGATNRPNLLDPALLRPGRFDELVYVPVPDEAARRHILAIQTKDMPIADDVDLDRMVERTQRYTGADLSDLVRRAGLHALRDDPSASIVTGAHFETALRETRPSVTVEMERDYEEILRTLKQEEPRQRVGFGIPTLKT
jgi:transitional endoplasmic reticulum ATPase